MEIVISIQLPESWLSFLRLEITQKSGNITKLTISAGTQIPVTSSKQLKS
jgi:hypothetical protein